MKKDSQHKRTLSVRRQTALAIFRMEKRTSPSRWESSAQVRGWAGTEMGCGGCPRESLRALGALRASSSSNQAILMVCAVL